MAKSSYCYQQAVLNAPDKYADLRLKIRTVFDESSGRYGYRRIHSSLKNDEFTVSEKVIRKLMQEEKLIVPNVKRKKYNSYKGEITPAVPNVIERNFHAEQPNMKWLTDITEFHIPAGKIYLSPIIDCFDGLPVSWTIGTSPDAASDYPFRSRCALPLARLDRKDGECRPYKINVKKGLFSRQFRLRRILRTS